MIGNEDTGVLAEGTTPHIDQESGNWMIGTYDTRIHAQGAPGKDAYQPFKGTFASDQDLNAAYPEPNDGDTAYVEETVENTTVLKVYDVVKGEWHNTGTTADSPEFGSGQFLNTVKIDDTQLANPADGSLPKAEDVMQLKAKLEGVTASEVKVQLITSNEGQNVFAGKVVGATGDIDHSGSNDANYKYVEFEISSNVKSIRFMTPTDTGGTAGWATGHYNDGNFVKDRSSVYVSGKEFTIEVKEGETHFRTNCYMMYGTPQTNRLLGFYCYLQSGKNVVSMIPKVADNFEGGVDKALSAEKGKQIADILAAITPITEYTTIRPQAGGVYTYLQNRQPGDVIEQVSESMTSNWTLLKFSIDETKTYYGTLKPQIDIDLGGVNVYYWGDANGLLLRKEKQMSSIYVNNTWTNYVLTPPEGATTLYVMARTQYVSRYSVSELQFINVQKLKDEIEDLNVNKADKSNFAFRQPLFPIKEYNTQTISQNAVVEGENIENAFASSTNFNLKLFKVKPSTKYILSGKASSANNGGIYVYYWADENKNYIRRDKSMGGADSEWGISEEYSLISPENAAYLYVKQVRVNGSATTVYPNLWYYTVYEETVFDSQEQYDSMFSDNKEITFLSIGNSYSEDMFGYVPYIMKKIAPEIKMTGLMLMQSANSAANPPEGVPSAHYRNFVDNNAVYSYSRWYYDRFAWRQSGGYNTSIKSALRGKTITIEGGVETEGNYLDPENRPKIDIIFLQASASSGNFKYTTGLMKQITDYLGYPVKFALFTCPYRASTTNNGNAYSYENILKGALGNLVFAKKYSELTNAAFLVSGCAAVQNARSIEALRLTGSYMEQSNNTSGYGYLSSIDGNHISDGIGRQTNAYTVVGTLLKNMGLYWKGIVGDKTVMDGPTVKWINCPHSHPSTVSTSGNPNTYGTDETTVALAQYCASMAIEHPFDIYDLSNYNEAVSYEGEDTMEFKRFYRIYTTVPTVVSLSNSQTVITEGEDYDSTITGTVNSIKILLGKLDITAFAYNSETQAIHIGNVSDTINISIK